MFYSDYLIYVDESGDSNLKNIDRDYPVFVLAFCIFRKSDYAEIVAPGLQKFKFRHFGHDAVVLHEHEMRRQRAPFVFLQSEKKRAAFMQDLSQLIDRAPMTVIAAAIRKNDLVRRYANPVNPYELALLFCMERSHAFLQAMGQQNCTTHIIAEKRGKKEDDLLELEFRRICDGANRRGKITSMKLVFADKRMNSAGLQIADLIARPIGLKVLRPSQSNRAYDIIEGKFRRNAAGRTDGWGIKIFP